MLYLHTRDTKLKLTNSLIMHWSHDKLQIQTHSLCFTCTHELQNRKKESLSLQLSSHEPCNDKQQNDQKLSAIQPQQTLRAVFLFIVQILLTTESNHIDISHMSTPGTWYKVPAGTIVYLLVPWYILVVCAHELQLY